VKIQVIKTKGDYFIPINKILHFYFVKLKGADSVYRVYVSLVLGESTEDYSVEEFTTEDEARKYIETLCEILNKEGEE